MKPENTPPLELTEIVDKVSSMVERVITEDNQAELLGPDLHRLHVERGLPHRMVLIGALLNDFARVAHSCVVADNLITDDELEQVYPIFFSLLRFLATVRPDYAKFVVVGPDELRSFLARYGTDSEPFGALSSATQWAGLDVCRRTARATGDEEPLEIYVRSQQRTMERILKLGGLSKEEQATRVRLEATMEMRRRLVDTVTPDREDPRSIAFCDPSGPRVFGAIAQAHQVWERDPFDVDSVHSEARDAFERLVDRVTAPDSDRRGRVLVLRGQSGAGKTHLMRAFRTYLHSRRRGFAGYMQMTTHAEDYARYVLVNLIDGLERPYDRPEVVHSGLMTLSDALVQGRLQLSDEERLALRDGDRDDPTKDTVSPLVDRLLEQPECQAFDPDLLRVLLYLQRRDPKIHARVLKYLRCEHFNRYDMDMLGGIAPRIDLDAPIRMIEQLGRLMAKVGDFAMVLLVDQMEDVFNIDDTGARIKSAVDVLLKIVDHVPTAVVVLSCLHDYYERVRKTLTQSSLDRLEHDPPPLTLNAGRSLAEIQQIVGRRLDHLYDQLGVRSHDDDPTFPIPPSELASRTNTRTRDVLDWCHEYQQSCMEGRGDAGPRQHAPSIAREDAPDLMRLEQAWNDFRTSFSPPVPDDEDELLALLGWAVARVGEEFEPALAIGARLDDGALVVDDGGTSMLVRVCNVTARGGALGGHLARLRARAGSRLVGLVRCSEFPDNPATQIFKDLGELVRSGGRRVTVENGDWRAILAFREFSREQGSDDALAAWRRDARPLSQLASLRSLLILDERAVQRVEAPALPPSVPPEPLLPAVGVPSPSSPSDSTAPSEPPVPTETAETAETEERLSLGRISGLSEEPIGMQLDSLVTHAAFLGSTGSGKTTFALNLIEQALERGIPALLIDRKGDLCTYARTEWWQSAGRDNACSARKKSLAERVEIAVYTPGAPSGRDLGLTVVPTNLAELSNHERAQECRQAAAAICTMLRYKDNSNDLARQSVLAKALEVLGRVVPGEVGLERVIDLIADEDATLVNAIGRLDTKHFSKLVDHLETLRLSRGELLAAEGERLDPARLLGIGRDDGKVQLSVVSTKFLGDSASIDFWVARLLAELSRWASQNPSPGLQALVLFDEADNYMPATRKPATKEPMQDLLRRGRSAGLGVMLATQSPGDLDYKSRDNIRTWFVGRVAENTAIAKMQPLLSECRTNVKGKLAGQEIGEFFMLQGGAVTEVKADRSLMDTEQIAEDEIRRLASQGAATSMALA